MIWKNVHQDELPGINQEVLLSVDGACHFTIFDATHRIFRMKDDPGIYFVIDRGTTMCWVALADLADPGQRIAPERASQH